jgi:ABC-type transport system involved in multi-copper enzyme maturation permease subunit
MFAGIRAVIRAELTTTARRRRYYFLRLAYGLILLAFFSVSYMAWESRFPEGATTEEVRRFAENAFIQFGSLQTWMVLFLVPALVAGVIADEHQRKTLHDLLASRLSSAEIMLGKLLARLAHLGVFVAIGVPVVCLLALYGALNPENVGIVYGSTATTVLFLAGGSMLISILARTPRDALLAAYGLEFLWLVAPPFLAPWTRYLDGLYAWVHPVNELILATNPKVFWDELTDVSNTVLWSPWARSAWMWRRGPWIFTRTSGLLGLPLNFPFVWMVALQAGFGLLFLIAAILGLRPLRGSSWSGARPRRGWSWRLSTAVKSLTNARAAAPVFRNRLLVPQSRPRCGEHPMLWKERFTPLGGGLSWLGGRPVAILILTVAGCLLFDPAWTLLKARLGSPWHSHERLRLTLGQDLRGATWLLSYLGIVAVAAAGAVSITAEREHDTWTSLATTLVTPDEVVLAKQFGAVWSARWVGLVFLVLWMTGLALGAFDPLGVLGAVLLAGLAAWGLAAVGVFVSPRAGNSTRAQAVTLLIVLVGVATWLPGALAGQLMPPAVAENPPPGSPGAVPSLLESWPAWLTVIAGSISFIYLLTRLTAHRLASSWG